MDMWRLEGHPDAHMEMLRGSGVEGACVGSEVWATVAGMQVE